MKTIFVYGTLKKDKSKNFYIVRDGGIFLGKASTKPKYRLLKHWLDYFPSMIEDEENGVSVEGELWSVSDETLKILDSIEGVTHNLFKRVPIELSNGDKVEGYLAVNKPFPAWNIGTKW
jgi:gamma-glutamylcyclotransferase (GGCT)/AIG2-like uncharacterized protein YtfP